LTNGDRNEAGILLGALIVGGLIGRFVVAPDVPPEPTPEVDFASACRQLDEADSLSIWVSFSTESRLEESGGFSNRSEEPWQSDLAEALAWEMSDEASNLLAAGEAQIGRKIRAAGSAMLDLGFALESLDFAPADEQLGNLRTALKPVDRAIRDAYRTFSEGIGPCAGFRPEFG
jgi:hypothetical protein